MNIAPIEKLFEANRHLIGTPKTPEMEVLKNLNDALSLLTQELFKDLEKIMPHIIPQQP